MPKTSKEIIIDTHAFGFDGNGKGWTKTVDGENYKFERLGWGDIPELEKVVDLQQRVWMMPDRDLVPSNLLAIADETGGEVIGAYGENGDMNGFLFALGATSGKQVLHMVGVEKGLRYGGLGWNLYVLLAATAVQKGVKNIEWTYDPLRGGNARLNLEKLGAKPYVFTVNKYGVVKSELYGENPTDRFTVNWDLNSRLVHQRLRQVNAGIYRPHGLESIQDISVVVRPGEVQEQQTIAVEIPGDNDNLDLDEAIRWRMQFREIMRATMTTKDGGLETEGNYQPIAFATGIEGMTRRSYYILEREKQN